MVGNSLRHIFQQFLSLICTHAPINRHVRVCSTRERTNSPEGPYSRRCDNERFERRVIGKLEVTDPVLCDKAGNIAGDHYAISFLTQMLKPHPHRRTVNFRKLRAIDVNSFKQCINENTKLQEVELPLDDLIANYNSSLKDIIDLQAPLLNRAITLRPHAPWYSDELRDAKHKRRQLERRWRSTKLEVHHQLYRDYCVVVNRLLCSNC